ncbi:MAG: hypothetical protein OXC26_25645, partial [Albidovulum sp.]|nr:hypothetical protein [Albidovulum sp.]
HYTAYCGKERVFFLPSGRAAAPEADKVSKVCHLTPNFVQSGALKSTEESRNINNLTIYHTRLTPA